MQEQVRIAKGPRKILAITIVALMVVGGLSTVAGTGVTVDGRPPIPPYLVYGKVYDTDGISFSNAEIIILNERTEETARTCIIDTGYYTFELDTFPSGYCLGDSITISAITEKGNASVSFVVQRMGFGEKRDIRLSAQSVAFASINKSFADKGASIAGIADVFGNEASMAESTDPEVLLNDENQMQNKTELAQDFSITGINFSNAKPTAGETVTVTATVSAIIGIPAVDVSFYMDYVGDGGLLDVKETTLGHNLALSAATELDTTGLKGDHYIIAVVDNADAYVEKDENNNLYFCKISIRTVSGDIDAVGGTVKEFWTALNDTGSLSRSEKMAINAWLSLIQRNMIDVKGYVARGETRQAINKINHCIDTSFLVVNKLSLVANQRKITPEDFQELVLKLRDVINALLDTANGIVVNPLSNDVAAAEKVLVDIRITGTLQLGRNPAWLALDNKLAVVLTHFQNAMAVLTVRTNAGTEFHCAFVKLSECKAFINQKMAAGVIPEVYGVWALDKINQIMMPISPDVFADLSRVTISGTVHVGTPCTITIPIGNDGVTSASNVAINVYDELPDGSVSLISATTKTLAASGGASTVIVNWVPTVKGEHRLKVALDPAGKLTEADTSDNVASAGIWVVGGTIFWDTTHYVNAEERYNNVEIVLRNLGSDLVINPGGKLIFEGNVDLVIERRDSTDPVQNIIVNPGGAFDIGKGSTITGLWQWYDYKFISNSYLNMTECTAQWMWGDDTNLDNPGGIQYLAGSKGTVIDSEIQWGTTHNLYVKDTSPSITDSNITWAGAIGLYVDGQSMPSINGCIFENNIGDGMILNGPVTSVRNNMVRYNGGNGISVYDMFSPASGKPDYSIGADLGYYVWSEGDVWHLSWTGDGASHFFNGTLRSARFTSLTDVYANIDDYLMGTKKIEFEDAMSGVEEAELDFKSTSNVVSFDLWIDGSRQASYVFIGAESDNPSGLPCILSNDTFVNGNTVAYNTGYGIASVLSSIPIIDNKIYMNGLGGIAVSMSSPYISGNFISATMTSYSAGVPNPLVSPALNQLLDSDFRSSTQILLQSATIDTSGFIPPVSSDLRIDSYAPGVIGPYLVQFNGVPTKDVLEEATAFGCDFYGYIPNNAYLVMMDETVKTSVERMPSVRWCGIYQPAYKLSPQVNYSVQMTNFTVLLLRSEGMQDALDEIDSLATRILQEWDIDVFHGMKIQTGPDIVNLIARIPEVYRLEPTLVPETFDEVSGEIVGGKFVGYGTYVNNLGYDGTNVIISVADTGLDTGSDVTMHADLSGRVVGYLDYTESDNTDGIAEDMNGHGTHCAGIVAGDATLGTTDANGYLYGLGVAPGAQVIAQRIFGDADNFMLQSNQQLTSDAVALGAQIGSNSWGMSTFGEYISADAEFDALTRDADPNTPGDQSYTLVFAAGNAGRYGLNSMCSPGVAKNVITVGASENYRPDWGSSANNPDEIAYFSSRGLTDDGRIKPDISAPGTYITSLQSFGGSPGLSGYPKIGSTYQYCSGTSQACPHVAGGAAIFVQYYENLFGVAPSPAMVKAALINGAVDIGIKDIPNPYEGWGRMNLTNVVEPKGAMVYDEATRLENGEWKEYRVTVTDLAQPLKITVAWTDFPGLPGAAKALVNDLDMYVIAPDGTELYGNQFANGWSDPSLVQRDTVNNVECIYVNPANLQYGTYIIRVVGVAINSDSVAATSEIDQDFAIVINYHGAPTSRGIAEMDKAAYRSDATIGITVIDADLASQPSAGVDFVSSLAGDSLAAILGPQTPEVFVGTASLDLGTANPSDALLQVSPGDTITMTYNDADDGTGMPASVTDTAIVDDTPPLITNIVATQASPGTIVVTWDTNELSDSTVMLGDYIPPSRAVTNPSLTTTHMIRLTSLVGGIKYYFSVRSCDDAGNMASDDNSGQYYAFKLSFNTDIFGILVTGQSSPIIEKNRIAGNYYGIITEGDSTALINDNLVVKNIDYGIQLKSDTQSSTVISNNNISSNPINIYVIGCGPTIVGNLVGWSLYGVATVSGGTPIIRNNILKNNGDGSWKYAGIFCSQASPTIFENDILSNGYGVYIESSNNLMINDNQILDNTYGIEMVFSSGHVQYNNVSHNIIWGMRAIGGSSTDIISNKLYNNRWGIWIAGGVVSIQKNNVSFNDVGIEVSGFWGSSTITMDVSNNNLTYNTYGIYDEASGYIQYQSIVHHNNITQNGYGVVKAYSSQYPIEISNNNITFNTADGVNPKWGANAIVSCNNITGNTRYGVNCAGAGNVVISGNNLSAYQTTAIFGGYGGYFEIYDNWINNTQYSGAPGIYIYWYTSGIISGNLLNGYGQGEAIRTYYAPSPYISISNNEINQWVTGISMNQMPPSSSTSAEITGNNIYGNVYGISCSQAFPSIVGNTISFGWIGIYCEQSGPYIADNIIDQNGNGIILNDASKSAEISLNLFNDGCYKRELAFFDPSAHLTPVPSLTIPDRAEILPTSSIIVSGESLGTPVELAPHVAGQRFSNIWGDTVYYGDKRYGGYSIVDYKASSMTEDHTSGMGKYPFKIWGDLCAWINYDDGYLYTYNFTTSITTQECYAAGGSFINGIYRDRVVWVDGNYDVSLYNLTTNVFARLISDPGVWYDFEPTVYGNKIAWMRQTKVAWEIPTAIYMYDLGSNGQFENGAGDDIVGWVTDPTTAVRDTTPYLYKNLLAWSAPITGTDIFDIQLMDLSTGYTSIITSGDLNKWRPRIWEDKVIYYTSYWHANGTVDWGLETINLTTSQKTIMSSQFSMDHWVFKDNAVWTEWEKSLGDEPLVHYADMSIWGQDIFPDDVSIDIANDGTIDWNYAGELNSAVFLTESNCGLATQLNNELPGSGLGETSIPIDTMVGAEGKVVLDYINIRYKLKTELVNNAITDSGSMGIQSFNTECVIVNCTVTNSGDWDVNVDGNSHLTFLNTTFNKNSVIINDDQSDITVQWFMHANVVMPDMTPLSGATIEVKNLQNTVIFNGITGADGRCPWIVCTEYTQDWMTKSFNAPYNVTAGKWALVGWAIPEAKMHRSSDVYIVLGGGGYNIYLEPGWRLISIPLEPYDNSIWSVLASANGHWDRAMWWDPTTYSWKQTATFWPPSFNRFLTIDNKIGFWINITSSCTLAIAGQVPTSTAIQLYSGWNMVGYPAVNDGSYNVLDLKTSTGVQIVEGFDGPAEYRTTVLDDTYILKKTEGYWVYVPTDTSWVVNW
jgi:parallel beta-helix repeat protein